MEGTQTQKKIFVDPANNWSEPGIEIETLSTGVAYAATASPRQSSRVVI